MNYKRLIFLTSFFFLIIVTGFSQNIISGIVVDSLSLNSLSGVHIKIKNSSRATASTANGSFSIVASDYDTLIFSLVGYRDLVYPLYGPESDILIRLPEELHMLDEVVTTAKPLKEAMIKKPPRYTHSDGSYIKTPSLAEGISSPFTYLSKTEREKRKLLKLRAENRRIKTYVEIVNDPDLKIEIMKNYSLNEKDYYELLARFNQEKKGIYLDNPEEIKMMLLNFIKTNRRR